MARSKETSRSRKSREDPMSEAREIRGKLKRARLIGRGKIAGGRRRGAQRRAEGVRDVGGIGGRVAGGEESRAKRTLRMEEMAPVVPERGVTSQARAIPPLTPA
jgi:hypothetical protein